MPLPCSGCSDGGSKLGGAWLYIGVGRAVSGVAHMPVPVLTGERELVGIWGQLGVGEVGVREVVESLKRGLPDSIVLGGSGDAGGSAVEGLGGGGK